LLDAQFSGPAAQAHGVVFADEPWFSESRPDRVGADGAYASDVIWGGYAAAAGEEVVGAVLDGLKLLGLVVPGGVFLDGELRVRGDGFGADARGAFARPAGSHVADGLPD